MKTRIQNEVTIISEKGIVSDTINYEVNSKPMSCKNTDKNWRHLYAMSTYSINDFTWEFRDFDGTVIETKPFDQSPPFNHRRKMFASM